MKLTLQKAYELAVKKWELIIKNDGNEPIYPVRIQNLRFGCGYCDLFFYDTSDYSKPHCTGCPLRIFEQEDDDWRGNCRYDEHPYEIWNNDKTKENAQAVLDLIIKTKPV